MPFVVTGSVQGTQEVITALRAIKDSWLRRQLRQGVTKATRLVTRAAKAAAPTGQTRQLKRSLGAVVRTYPSGVIVGVVGPRRGFKVVAGGRAVDPTKYAHLTEGGRRAVTPKRKDALRFGLGRGRKAREQFAARAAAVSARRWLAGAWAASRGPAREVIASHLRQALGAGKLKTA